MEINVVATDAFAHKTEWEHNVHPVLPREGAQYVLQYLFDFCRQMTLKGGMGWVYPLREITSVWKVYYNVMSLRQRSVFKCTVY